MSKNILSDRELDTMYQEMLNEVYGTVKIAGLEYETADALSSVDPTAYRCGFSDYISSLIEDGTIHENADGEYVEGPASDDSDDE